MAKVKFGQRIIRAFVYGFPLGFILYVMSVAASHAVQGLPQNMGLIGFVTGLGSALGIELSKDLEQS